MIKLPGNCMTTAMGILPHKEITAAMQVALTVDIPFWPQLPRYSFYEDMYVQVSENFPGIRLDEQKRKLWLDTNSFYEELGIYAVNSDDESTFMLSDAYSAAFRAFLTQDLSGYAVVRGQNIGPISFGLKITDENMKPIIYNDEIRSFMFDFIARKINVQYRQLLDVHPVPFVWVDEPGLEILFGSFTGYASDLAKRDFAAFLDTLEGPRGVHLCGNPDWSFLLSGLDLDILSVDIYGNGHIFTRYVDEIKSFLERGAIISWGIVPTLTEELDGESVDMLAGRLEDYWKYLSSRGIPLELILDRAWLAPARCCLVNSDGAVTVERAFQSVNRISRQLRQKYGLT
ncbi:hypothetical protein [Desulfallas thermosapovorans]|uniref:Methionine synthase II (Cobalamin-independent) n=1 Tax=Desulfallas thermosapovorans DSM 6562 TaxID=1121431 RepID=A0A5S4ZYI3_9FIRM|nr:hypothetical protein [Desulfallas thermosapovorans]TYO97314.1 hypothetical protein LX24_00505 [Desulfallas thermosapovorans DSM 6562]